MDKPTTEIVRVSGEHIHEIVNDHDDAQCHTSRNNCKRKATENITDRTSKIMRHELCAAENTEMVSDGIGNIRRTDTDKYKFYCKLQVIVVPLALISHVR
jgi:hypothetical protein